MVDRSCREPGCGTPITHQSKTGRCRPCALRVMHADPAYQQRRLAGLRRRNAEPGEMERRVAWLQSGRQNMSPEAKANLTAHGHAQVRKYLSKPEIQARAQSPDAIARRTAAYVETCLGWCPVELRPAYEDMVRRKRFTAAEARAMIEAEIPGTTEHARRQIASHHLAGKLRAERDRNEAY